MLVWHRSSKEDAGSLMTEHLEECPASYRKFRYIFKKGKYTDGDI
jgi:hypothetical protein